MSVQTITPPPGSEQVSSLASAFGVSAPELARRIDIPVQLPPTYKGEPLRCLSDSSISKYLTCPDEWRRHYLLGERAAPSGAVFLGSCLDGAQNAYYRSRLEGGVPLNERQLKECFEERWRLGLAEQRERFGGVRWDEGRGEHATLAVGLSAIEVFLKRLARQAGTPLAVQREFEFPLTDGLEWTVMGRVDLDAIRPIREFLAADGTVIAAQELLDPRPTVEVIWAYAPEDLRPALEKRDPDHSDAEAAAYQAPVDVPVARVPGDPLDREVSGPDDAKATKRPIYKRDADSRSQASLYCMEGELIRGVEINDLGDLQLLMPAKGQRKSVTAKITRTKRTREQHESFRVLIAQVAAQIVGAYETFGPDKPWGFAPPGHWKCEPNSTGTDGKHCIYWRTCPRGIGLRSAA